VCVQAGMGRILAQKAESLLYGFEAFFEFFTVAQLIILFLSYRRVFEFKRQLFVLIRSQVDADELSSLSLSYR